MKEYTRNGIKILIENTPMTPRMCVGFFFKTNEKEKYYGLDCLLARLLLQGTDKYSHDELADLFEKDCIDVSAKSKQDFIKVSAMFLNEDFNKAMELVSEILLNSNFNNFEKEIFKMKGEITSDLDSPFVKLTDEFVKNVFDNHPYSSTLSKYPNELDKVEKEDIINAHKRLLNTTKAIVIAGDIKDEEYILNYFENHFSFMKNNDVEDLIPDMFKLDLSSNKYLFLPKNDANQAQIIQGCLIDSFKSDKCAKYAVLNNILGASGLSSRLFVNLRDKQGLAYTVRSQYETLLHSGIFTFYIATKPTNINKSLEGFYLELEKLKNEPPSEVELKGAKENLSGRFKYFSQNNAQIVALKGYHYLAGLGLNYEELFLDDIFNTSKEDVQKMASYLLDLPKICVVLAPEEYRNYNNI